MLFSLVGALPAAVLASSRVHAIDFLFPVSRDGGCIPNSEMAPGCTLLQRSDHCERVDGLKTSLPRESWDEMNDLARSKAELADQSGALHAWTMELGIARRRDMAAAITNIPTW